MTAEVPTFKKHFSEFLVALKTLSETAAVVMPVLVEQLAKPFQEHMGKSGSDALGVKQDCEDSAKLFVDIRQGLESLGALSDSSGMDVEALVRAPLDGHVPGWLPSCCCPASFANSSAGSAPNALSNARSPR